MQVKQIVSVCIIGLASLRSWQEASAQQYTFVDVKYPGANETIVEGINDAGVVVGTYGSSIDARQAVQPNTFGFILTGNAYQSLQAFGANATSATAINNSGKVVGYYLSSANTFRPFVYNGATFVDILPPTANEAVASDIDNSGVIIGSYSTNSSLSAFNQDFVDIHGFRAIPNGAGGYNFQTFDFPGAAATYGNGRNNAGVEVGTAYKQSIFGQEAIGYALPNSEYRYPPADGSLITITQFASINDNGRVLGNATKYAVDAGDGQVKGYKEAFYVNVADLNSPSPITHNIPLPGPSCGFVYSPSQEPCRKEAANDNELGQVVGYYDNNDGLLSGFIATPIELPIVGDYNHDGSVGAADYIVWRKTDGSSEGYNLWRTNFGRPAGPGTGAAGTLPTQVPEPATFVLLMFSAAGCWCLRQRRAT